MLIVNDLSVFYGKIKVVHNINFTIEEGSCVSLLGPNGAGKTSTISSILGTVNSTGTINFCNDKFMDYFCRRRYSKYVE